MKQKVSFVFHWTKGLQRKAEFFCIYYFWRTKRKSTETITERCFSCQNKSVCQKLARSCKKWKSAKIRYMPFLHEGLQLLHYFIVSLQKSKTVYSLPWKKTFPLLCTQSPCVHSYHFTPGMCLSIIGPYYMNIHWMYCRMTKLKKNFFGHINITVSKCFFNNNSLFSKI